MCMNTYFIGIGGVGIGPLAQIAADAGYNVSGSDPEKGPITESLERQGIPISHQQDGSFLRACHQEKPIDWVICSSAIDENNPELQAVRELGIKYSKRDEFLAHILEKTSIQLIAIAGTHGKTTTTSMMIWALQQLKVPISYSVGTTLSFAPSGAYSPESRYFIYECDEYDRNFLHFSPELSLITSIDYDHPDTYPTQQSYLDAFEQFGQQSRQIIAWRDQHSELFAKHPDSWILGDTLEFSLAGAHNRRNATLVQKALEKLGVAGDAKSALNSYPGSHRRFEKLADNLYSDYAHHPTEIAATLQLAREISDRVVAVYHPHQNIRQHELLGKYTDQFELAEKVYWLPTYLSREDPDLPVLAPEQLFASLTNKQNVTAAGLNDDLWKEIQEAREDGALVLLMGAGSVDLWAREILKA